MAVYSRNCPSRPQNEANLAHLDSSSNQFGSYTRVMNHAPEASQAIGNFRNVFVATGLAFLMIASAGCSSKRSVIERAPHATKVESSQQASYDSNTSVRTECEEAALGIATVVNRAYHNHDASALKDVIAQNAVFVDAENKEFNILESQVPGDAYWMFDAAAPSVAGGPLVLESLEVPGDQRRGTEKCTFFVTCKLPTAQRLNIRLSVSIQKVGGAWMVSRFTVVPPEIAPELLSAVSQWMLNPGARAELVIDDATKLHSSVRETKEEIRRALKESSPVPGQWKPASPYELATLDDSKDKVVLLTDVIAVFEIRNGELHMTELGTQPNELGT